MIHNTNRSVRSDRQFVPENTWERLFSTQKTGKRRSVYESWWYDEK